MSELELAEKYSSILNRAMNNRIDEISKAVFKDCQEFTRSSIDDYIERLIERVEESAVAEAGGVDSAVSEEWESLSKVALENAIDDVVYSDDVVDLISDEPITDLRLFRYVLIDHELIERVCDLIHDDFEAWFVDDLPEESGRFCVNDIIARAIESLENARDLRFSANVYTIMDDVMKGCHDE